MRESGLAQEAQTLREEVAALRAENEVLKLRGEVRSGQGPQAFSVLVEPRCHESLSCAPHACPSQSRTPSRTPHRARPRRRSKRAQGTGAQALPSSGVT